MQSLGRVHCPMLNHGKINACKNFDIAFKMGQSRTAAADNSIIIRGVGICKPKTSPILLPSFDWNELFLPQLVLTQFSSAAAQFCLWELSTCWPRSLQWLESTDLTPSKRHYYAVLNYLGRCLRKDYAIGHIHFLCLFAHAKSLQSLHSRRVWVSTNFAARSSR